MRQSKLPERSLIRSEIRRETGTVQSYQIPKSKKVYGVDAMIPADMSAPETFKPAPKFNLPYSVF